MPTAVKCYHVQVSIPIVISGSIAIDRIMNFRGKYTDLINPKKLDSLAIAPLVQSLTISNGGVGANIAYNLALLGDRPILLGVVGEDASLYMEGLGSRGVDISYVHVSKFNTATYQAVTDSAGCHVGGFFPGAMADSGNLTFAPWRGQDALVVVSPHDPAAMIRQVNESKKWGLRLCYDVSWQVGDMTSEQLSAGLEAAEILVLNDHEMSMLSKNTGLSHEAITAKVPVVITTLAEKGSLIEGTKAPNAIRVAAAAPNQVLDSTSAGDAFRAGFLHGYVRQWPLKTCAQLGATVAAYAIETKGSQNHLFTLKELTKRYKQNFNEALPA